MKPYCTVNTVPINRIGLPRYRWLVEANSCINSGCLGGNCNTIFVSPNTMAASFNRTSWWHKGDVVSTDMRVANNYGDGSQTDQVGLTGYGPNINMVKDPRYGRNSELPGEGKCFSTSTCTKPCPLNAKILFLPVWNVRFRSDWYNAKWPESAGTSANTISQSVLSWMLPLPKTVRV